MYVMDFEFYSHGKCSEQEKDMKALIILKELGYRRESASKAQFRGCNLDAGQRRQQLGPGQQQWGCGLFSFSFLLDILKAEMKGRIGSLYVGCNQIQGPGIILCYLDCLGERSPYAEIEIPESTRLQRKADSQLCSYGS